MVVVVVISRHRVAVHGDDLVLVVPHEDAMAGAEHEVGIDTGLTHIRRQALPVTVVPQPINR